MVVSVRGWVGVSVLVLGGCGFVVLSVSVSLKAKLK